MSGPAAAAPDVPFDVLVELGKNQGLSCLAVMTPPSRLAADGLDRMLADGVGDMAYMNEHRELRLTPNGLLPSARSILAVALPYHPQREDATLRRARYAAGSDYHQLLRKKLARVGDALNQRFAAGWTHRAVADSAPVNERTLARLAGLGWIGRNALLIAPDAGSYRFLGFLLSEAPMEIRSAGHGADRCGSCTACERRCPTAALVDRRVISERCISYLTIEHHGVIARDLAQRFEGWWFGCDLCQEVCPWNRFAPPAGDPKLVGADADSRLFAITAESFDTAFAGRAVRRIGYERYRRNLLVALFSLGRLDEAGPIIAEGLPLVLAQARELGIP
ncbi:MAG: tRNA epoxyqueuosine(34) reductase QueG [Planctomycetes bacterium]|nr:tRNA epoxyqueuosine(34) reductase QueG [Planctomycetota bacterium]